MIDDIDRAQQVLEGKCPRCFYALPDHRFDCPNNPWIEAINELGDLKTEVEELFYHSVNLVELHEDKLAEINYILKHIQDKKKRQ